MKMKLMYLLDWTELKTEKITLIETTMNDQDGQKERRKNMESTFAMVEAGTPDETATADENYDGNFKELGKVSEGGYVEVPNSVTAKLAPNGDAVPFAEAEFDGALAAPPSHERWSEGWADEHKSLPHFPCLLFKANVHSIYTICGFRSSGCILSEFI